MSNAMQKDLEIIGVPLDLGCNKKGAIMGPAAIRSAEISEKLQELGIVVVDQGDVPVPLRHSLSKDSIEKRGLAEITAVCLDLAGRTKKAVDSGKIPLSMGGDHSLAIGSISGVSASLQAKGQKLGLIWIDAHADVNIPDTSPSGNIHGMPLSTVLGDGFFELKTIGYEGAKVRPENVALLGIRALDEPEKNYCKRKGIRYFTMKEIDERGMKAVMTEAIALASRGTAGIHLSFDMDGVDPLYAPGVSTAVTGGLTYREAHLVLELIAETGKLLSMDFVELNPLEDLAGRTARLAVDLIASSLGRSII